MATTRSVNEVHDSFLGGALHPTKSTNTDAGLGPLSQFQRDVLRALFVEKTVGVGDFFFECGRVAHRNEKSNYSWYVL